jgi:hypothetical protein
MSRFEKEGKSAKSQSSTRRFAHRHRARSIFALLFGTSVASPDFMEPLSFMPASPLTLDNMNETDNPPSDRTVSVLKRDS